MNISGISATNYTLFFNGVNKKDGAARAVIGCPGGFYRRTKYAACIPFE